MKQEFRVMVLLPEGMVEETLISATSSAPWTISYDGLGMKSQKFSGTDLFEALAHLRRRLEGGGCRLLCAGARRDVFPSGMTRSMGGARKAYIMELGKPATQVIDIFAEALPSQVGTVHEQEQYRQKWISSLKESQ